MFERFTDRARSVLVLAQDEARQLHHGYIGTEHILLGLMRQGDGVGADVLTSFDITLDSVRNEVRAMLGEVHDPTAQAQNASPPFTPRAKKVLELSLREALKLGHSYIGTEHILLGIIREGESVATQVLAELGVSLATARERVMARISGHEHGEQIGDQAETPVASHSVRVAPGSAGPRCPQCRADVSEAGRYRKISVKPDASSDDENPLRTYVIYCSACGATLHIFTHDPAS